MALTRKFVSFASWLVYCQCILSATPEYNQAFLDVRSTKSLSICRLVIAVFLIAMAATLASAYTLVMRNGRLVEIPNEFTITNSTLTYKAGTDIQITIQLNTVDIAATERANGEPKGSFFLKASAPKKIATPAVQTRPRAVNSVKSITNQDLEVYRRARIQGELAYENRRKELGLPPLEDRRREAAEIQERAREQLLSMNAQEKGSEEYWRSRATPLRTELAATAAQIDFVRRRIDEIPTTNSLGTFSSVIPYGTFGNPTINFPFQSGITPNLFPPSLVNSGFRTRASINLNNRGSRYINPGQRRGRFPNNQGRFYRGRGGRGFPSLFGGSVLSLPFQTFDSSLQREELINELDDLLIHHAGLIARWRDLEDEARRAGAYPGWLRP